MSLREGSIRQTYLAVSFLTTFAASLIRGIDALFLLDAGLSTSQVFAVYAFMTLGTTLFEIPTGSVADVRGRRLSLLIGTLGLAATTALYWLLWSSGAGFWAFAAVTFGFGVAYTFSSGATEAWLVDALDATGYDGTLDAVFARNQTVTGVAMLTGTLAGGLIAQVSNLGVPYLLRFGLLVACAGLVFVRVHDLGFTPRPESSLVNAVKDTAADAITYGWSAVPIRAMMLAGLFTFAAAGFIFYGMQPYLLELYGDTEAYTVSALAAMIVSGAQIIGGVVAGPIRRRFSSRSAIIATATTAGALAVIGIGVMQSFVATVALLAVWSMALAVMMPVRQAFLNAQIPSEQRASVLSVDSLVSSAGSIPAQPLLGRLAGSQGYPAAFVAAGVIQIVAVPFVLWSRTRCPAHANRTTTHSPVHHAA